MIIPPELSDAYFLSRTGWTWLELQSTPAYVIDQIFFVWHLEDIASKD